MPEPTAPKRGRGRPRKQGGPSVAKGAGTGVRIDTTSAAKSLEALFAKTDRLVKQLEKLESTSNQAINAKTSASTERIAQQIRGTTAAIDTIVETAPRASRGMAGLSDALRDAGRRANEFEKKALTSMERYSASAEHAADSSRELKRSTAELGAAVPEKELDTLYARMDANYRVSQQLHRSMGEMSKSDTGGFFETVQKGAQKGADGIGRLIRSFARMGRESKKATSDTNQAIASVAIGTKDTSAAVETGIGKWIQALDKARYSARQTAKEMAAPIVVADAPAVLRQAEQKRDPRETRAGPAAGQIKTIEKSAINIQSILRNIGQVGVYAAIARGMKLASDGFESAAYLANLFSRSLVVAETAVAKWASVMGQSFVFVTGLLAEHTVTVEANLHIMLDKMIDASRKQFGILSNVIAENTRDITRDILKIGKAALEMAADIGRAFLNMDFRDLGTKITRSREIIFSAAKDIGQSFSQIGREAAELARVMARAFNEEILRPAIRGIKQFSVDVMKLTQDAGQALNNLYEVVKGFSVGTANALASINYTAVFHGLATGALHAGKALAHGSYMAVQGLQLLKSAITAIPLPVLIGLSIALDVIIYKARNMKDVFGQFVRAADVTARAVGHIEEAIVKLIRGMATITENALISIDPVLGYALRRWNDSVGRQLQQIYGMMASFAANVHSLLRTVFTLDPRPFRRAIIGIKIAWREFREDLKFHSGQETKRSIIEPLKESLQWMNNNIPGMESLISRPFRALAEHYKKQRTDQNILSKALKFLAAAFMPLVRAAEKAMDLFEKFRKTLLLVLNPIRMLRASFGLLKFMIIDLGKATEKSAMNKLLEEGDKNVKRLITAYDKLSATLSTLTEWALRSYRVLKNFFDYLGTTKFADNIVFGFQWMAKALELAGKKILDSIRAFDPAKAFANMSKSLRSRSASLAMDILIIGDDINAGWQKAIKSMRRNVAGFAAALVVTGTIISGAWKNQMKGITTEGPFKKISDAWKKGTRDLRDRAVDFIAAITVAGAVVTKSLSEAFAPATRAINRVIKAMSVHWNTAVERLRTAGQAISSAINTMKDRISSSWSQMAADIRQRVQDVVKAIKSFGDLLKRAWQEAYNIQPSGPRSRRVPDPAKDIANMSKTLKSKSAGLATVILLMGENIARAWSQFSDRMSSAFNNFSASTLLRWEQVSKVFRTKATSFSFDIESVGEEIRKRWDSLRKKISPKGFVGLMSSLWAGLSSGIATGANAVVNAIKRAGSFISDAWDTFKKKIGMKKKKAKFDIPDLESGGDDGPRMMYNMAEKQSNAVDRAATKIKEAWKDFTQNVTQKIRYAIGHVRSALEGVTLDSVIMGFGELVFKAVEAAEELVYASWVAFDQHVGQKMLKVIDRLKTSLEGVTIESVIREFGNLQQKALREITQWLGTAWDNFGASIRENIKSLKATVISAWERISKEIDPKSFLRGILPNLETFKKDFQEAGSNLNNWIAEIGTTVSVAWDELRPRIDGNEILASIGSGIGSSKTKLEEVGSSLDNWIAEIGTTVSVAWDELKPKIDGNEILSNIGSGLETAKGILDNLGKEVKTKIESIGEWIKKAWQKFRGTDSDTVVGQAQAMDRMKDSISRLIVVLEELTEKLYKLSGVSKGVRPLDGMDLGEDESISRIEGFKKRLLEAIDGFRDGVRLRWENFRKTVKGSSQKAAVPDNMEKETVTEIDKTEKRVVNRLKQFGGIAAAAGTAATVLIGSHFIAGWENEMASFATQAISFVQERFDAISTGVKIAWQAMPDLGKLMKDYGDLFATAQTATGAVIAALQFKGVRESVQNKLKEIGDGAKNTLESAWNDLSSTQSQQKIVDFFDSIIDFGEARFRSLREWIESQAPGLKTAMENVMDVFRNLRNPMRAFDMTDTLPKDVVDSSFWAKEQEKEVQRMKEIEIKQQKQIENERRAREERERAAQREAEKQKTAQAKVSERVAQVRFKDEFSADLGDILMRVQSISGAFEKVNASLKEMDALIDKIRGILPDTFNDEILSPWVRAESLIASMPNLILAWIPAITQVGNVLQSSVLSPMSGMGSPGFGGGFGPGFGGGFGGPGFGGIGGFGLGSFGFPAEDMQRWRQGPTQLRQPRFQVKGRSGIPGLYTGGPNAPTMSFDAPAFGAPGIPQRRGRPAKRHGDPDAMRWKEIASNEIREAGSQHLMQQKNTATAAVEQIAKNKITDASIRGGDGVPRLSRTVEEKPQEVTQLVNKLGNLIQLQRTGIGPGDVSYDHYNKGFMELLRSSDYRSSYGSDYDAIMSLSGKAQTEAVRLQKEDERGQKIRSRNQEVIRQRQKSLQGLTKAERAQWLLQATKGKVDITSSLAPPAPVWDDPGALSALTGRKVTIGEEAFRLKPKQYKDLTSKTAQVMYAQMQFKHKGKAFPKFKLPTSERFEFDMNDIEDPGRRERLLLDELGSVFGQKHAKPVYESLRSDKRVIDLIQEHQPLHGIPGQSGLIEGGADAPTMMLGRRNYDSPGLVTGGADAPQMNFLRRLFGGQVQSQAQDFTQEPQFKKAMSIMSGMMAAQMGGIDQQRSVNYQDAQRRFNDIFPSTQAFQNLGEQEATALIRRLAEPFAQAQYKHEQDQFDRQRRNRTEAIPEMDRAIRESKPSPDEIFSPASRTLAKSVVSQAHQTPEAIEGQRIMEELVAGLHKQPKAPQQSTPQKTVHKQPAPSSPFPNVNMPLVRSETTGYTPGRGDMPNLKQYRRMARKALQRDPSIAARLDKRIENEPDAWSHYLGIEDYRAAMLADEMEMSTALWPRQTYSDKARSMRKWIESPEYQEMRPYMSPTLIRGAARGGQRQRRNALRIARLNQAEAGHKDDMHISWLRNEQARNDARPQGRRPIRGRDFTSGVDLSAPRMTYVSDYSPQIGGKWETWKPEIPLADGSDTKKYWVPLQKPLSFSVKNLKPQQMVSALMEDAKAQRRAAVNEWQQVKAEASWHDIQIKTHNQMFPDDPIQELGVQIAPRKTENELRYATEQELAEAGYSIGSAEFATQQKRHDQGYGTVMGYERTSIDESMRARTDRDTALLVKSLVDSTKSYRSLQATLSEPERFDRGEVRRARKRMKELRPHIEGLLKAVPKIAMVPQGDFTSLIGGEVDLGTQTTLAAKALENVLPQTFKKTSVFDRLGHLFDESDITAISNRANESVKRWQSERAKMLGEYDIPDLLSGGPGGPVMMAKSSKQQQTQQDAARVTKARQLAKVFSSAATGEGGVSAYAWKALPELLGIDSSIKKEVDLMKFVSDEPDKKRKIFKAQELLRLSGLIPDLESRSQAQRLGFSESEINRISAEAGTVLKRLEKGFKGRVHDTTQETRQPQAPPKPKPKTQGRALGPAFVKRIKQMMDETELPFYIGDQIEYAKGSKEYEQGWRFEQIKARIAEGGDLQFFELRQGKPAEGVTWQEGFRYDSEGRMVGEQLSDDELMSIVNDRRFRKRPINPATGTGMDNRDMIQMFRRRDSLDEMLKRHRMDPVPSDAFEFSALAQMEGNLHAQETRKKLKETEAALGPLLRSGRVVSPSDAEKEILTQIQADPRIASLEQKKKSAPAHLASVYDQEIGRVISGDKRLRGLQQQVDSITGPSRLSDYEVQELRRQRETSMDTLVRMGQGANVQDSAEILNREFMAQAGLNERMKELQSQRESLERRTGAKVADDTNREKLLRVQDRTRKFTGQMKEIDDAVKMTQMLRSQQWEQVVESLKPFDGIEGQIGKVKVLADRKQKAHDLLGTRLESPQNVARWEKRKNELETRIRETQDNLSLFGGATRDAMEQAIAADVESLKEVNKRLRESVTDIQEKKSRVQTGKQLERDVASQLSDLQEDLGIKRQTRQQRQDEDLMYLDQWVTSEPLARETRLQAKEDLSKVDLQIADLKTQQTHPSRSKKVRQGILTIRAATMLDRLRQELPEATDETALGRLGEIRKALTTGEADFGSKYDPKILDTPWYKKNVEPIVRGIARQQTISQVETALKEAVLSTGIITPPGREVRRALERELEKMRTDQEGSLFSDVHKGDARSGKYHRDTLSGMLKDLRVQAGIAQELSPRERTGLLPEELGAFDPIFGAARDYITGSLETQRAFGFGKLGKKSSMGKRAERAKARYQAHLMLLTSRARDGQIDEASLNTFLDTVDQESAKATQQRKALDERYHTLQRERDEFQFRTRGASFEEHAPEKFKEMKRLEKDMKEANTREQWLGRFAQAGQRLRKLPIESWGGELEYLTDPLAFNAMRRANIFRSDGAELEERSQAALYGALMLGQGKTAKHFESAYRVAQASRQEGEWLRGLGPELYSQAARLDPGIVASESMLEAFGGRELGNLLDERHEYMASIYRRMDQTSPRAAQLQQGNVQRLQGIQSRIVEILSSQEVADFAEQRGLEPLRNQALINELTRQERMVNMRVSQEGRLQGLYRAGKISREDRQKEARARLKDPGLRKDLELRGQELITGAAGLHQAATSELERTGIRQLESEVLPEMLEILGRQEKGYPTLGKEMRPDGITKDEAKDLARFTELATTASAIVNRHMLTKGKSQISTPFRKASLLGMAAIDSTFTSPLLKTVEEGGIRDIGQMTKIVKQAAINVGKATASTAAQEQLANIQEPSLSGLWQAVSAGAADRTAIDRAAGDVEIMQALMMQASTEVSMLNDAKAKIANVLRDTGLSKQERDTFIALDKQMSDRLEGLERLTKIQLTSPTGPIGIMGRQTVGRVTDKQRQELEKRFRKSIEDQKEKVRRLAESEALGMQDAYGSEIYTSLPEEVKERRLRQLDEQLRTFEETFKFVSTSGGIEDLEAITGSSRADIRSSEEITNRLERQLTQSREFQRGERAIRQKTKDFMVTLERGGADMEGPRATERMINSLLRSLKARIDLGEEQLKVKNEFDKIEKDHVETLRSNEKVAKKAEERALAAIKDVRRMRDYIRGIEGGIGSLYLTKGQIEQTREFLFYDREGKELEIDRDLLMKSMRADEEGRIPFDIARQNIAHDKAARESHGLTKATSKIYQEKRRPTMTAMADADTPRQLVSEFSSMNQTLKHLHTVVTGRNWMAARSGMLDTPELRNQAQFFGALTQGVSPEQLTGDEKALQKILNDKIKRVVQSDTPTGLRSDLRRMGAWDESMAAYPRSVRLEDKDLYMIAEREKARGEGRSDAFVRTLIETGASRLVDSGPAQRAEAKYAYQNLIRRQQQASEIMEYIPKERTKIGLQMAGLVAGGDDPIKMQALNDRVKLLDTLEKEVAPLVQMINKMSRGEKIDAATVEKTLKDTGKLFDSISTSALETMTQVNKNIDEMSKKMKEQFVALDQRDGEMDRMIREQTKIAKQIGGMAGMKRMQDLEMYLAIGGTDADADMDGFSRALAFEQAPTSANYAAYRGATARQRQMARRAERTRRGQQRGGYMQHMLGHYAFDFLGGDLLYSLPAYFGATAAVRGIGEGFQRFGRAEGWRDQIREQTMNRGIGDPDQWMQQLMTGRRERRIPIAEDQYLRYSSMLIDSGFTDPKQMLTILGAASEFGRKTDGEPDMFIEGINEALGSNNFAPLGGHLASIGRDELVLEEQFKGLDTYAEKMKFILDISEELDTQMQSSMTGIQGLMTDSSSSIEDLATGIAKDLTPAISEVLLLTTKLTDAMLKMGENSGNATANFAAMALAAGAFTLGMKKGLTPMALAKGVQGISDRVTLATQDLGAVGSYLGSGVSRETGIDYMRRHRGALAVSRQEARITSATEKQEALSRAGLRARFGLPEIEPGDMRYKDSLEKTRKELEAEREVTKQKNRQVNLKKQIASGTEKNNRLLARGRSILRGMGSLLANLAVNAAFAVLAAGVTIFITKLLEARQATRDVADELKALGAWHAERDEDPIRAGQEVAKGLDIKDKTPEAMSQRIKETQAKLDNFASLANQEGTVLSDIVNNRFSYGKKDVMTKMTSEDLMEWGNVRQLKPGEYVDMPTSERELEALEKQGYRKHYALMSPIEMGEAIHRVLDETKRESNTEAGRLQKPTDILNRNLKEAGLHINFQNPDQSNRLMSEFAQLDKAAADARNLQAAVTAPAYQQLQAAIAANPITDIALTEAQNRQFEEKASIAKLLQLADNDVTTAMSYRRIIAQNIKDEKTSVYEGIGSSAALTEEEAGAGGGEITMLTAKGHREQVMDIRRRISDLTPMSELQHAQQNALFTGFESEMAIAELQSREDIPNEEWRQEQLTLLHELVELQKVDAERQEALARVNLQKADLAHEREVAGMRDLDPVERARRNIEFTRRENQLNIAEIMASGMDAESEAKALERAREVGVLLVRQARDEMHEAMIDVAREKTDFDRWFREEILGEDVEPFGMGSTLMRGGPGERERGVEAAMRLGLKLTPEQERARQMRPVLDWIEENPEIADKFTRAAGGDLMNLQGLALQEGYEVPSIKKFAATDPSMQSFRNLGAEALDRIDEDNMAKDYLESVRKTNRAEDLQRKLDRATRPEEREEIQRELYRTELDNMSPALLRGIGRSPEAAQYLGELPSTEEMIRSGNIRTPDGAVAYEDKLREREEEAGKDYLEDEYIKRQEELNEKMKIGEELTMKLGNALGQTLNTAIQSIWDKSISFADAVQNIWANMLTSMSNMLLEAAFNQFAGMDGPLGFLFGGMASAFGGGRAEGGMVEMGKRYIVGEYGQEEFVPYTDGYIVPNARSQARDPGMDIDVGDRDGGSTTITAPVTVNATVNVSGSGETSEEEVERIRSELSKEVMAAAEAAAVRVITRESRSGGRLTRRVS